METIFATLISGILATTAMSGLLYLVHFSGLANADMIRALGSMITKQYDTALLPGLAAHIVGGTIFAFPYAILLSAFPVHGIAATAAVGAGIGLFHGFVFSFVLIAMVAESHPIEQFREAGSVVALAHILAHVIYGTIMGALVSLFGLHFGLSMAA